MGANRDQFALIENISAISGEAAADLRETLDKIVAAIAEGMEVEVCSLYLFDPQRERLVLRATIGLDRDSVGKVSMRQNEGLVGMVIEKGEAVGVTDAISHPRYKYFPETGEERYHTFLGVPVQDGRNKPIGVLVVQTLTRRKFTKSEARLLKTAANQVASDALSNFLASSAVNPLMLGRTLAAGSLPDFDSMTSAPFPNNITLIFLFASYYFRSCYEIRTVG